MSQLYNASNKPILKNVDKSLKPFVKWAGGKTQFLETINLLLPNNYHRFIEPFVGGGAVFLSTQPKQLIINDLNQELITAYRVTKNNPPDLIKLLQEYEKKHSQEFYEHLRKQEKEQTLAQLKQERERESKSPPTIPKPTKTTPPNSFPR